MIGSRRTKAARITALVLAVSLPVGCSKTSEPADTAAAVADDDGEGPRLHNPDPSPPAPKSLVPPIEGGSIGLQPGYLDGAFLFASIRAGAFQEFGQSLPLSPSAARDLAELGNVLGADPRVDDVLAHLGIEPNSRTSLSVRPVVDHASSVKQTLDEAGPLLDELHRPDHPSPDQPEAPPLSGDAEAFLDRVETLGVHLRWHIPIADRTRASSLRDAMKLAHDDRWATTCASLQPALLCSGESDGLIVVHELQGGLQVDALVFFNSAHDEPDTELRRAVIQQAVALPGGRGIPAVAALRGDANLLVASTPTFTAIRASEMVASVSTLRWEGRAALTTGKARDASLWALHEPERIFEGIKIEANLDGQRIHTNFGWLPTALGKQLMADTFVLLEVDADVPSLAELCAGSVVCARSRGTPSLARFEPLATGVFADPAQLEAALEQGSEEWLLLMLLLESWPNALGTLAKFPGQSMGPPESTLAENSKQAAERVLAFGLAVRSLSISKGETRAEFVGFARMPAKDLSALRGLVRMAMEGLAPVTIEGVPGAIESVVVSDDDFPARFYSITDPEVATGSWGWAVIADSDPRVRWMTGLARDDGTSPIGYLEMSDLWKLVGGVEPIVGELGHAQAWLSGRSLRAQWTEGPDGPEIRMLVDKRQP